MNCKPGQLAICTSLHSKDNHYRGLPVVVKELFLKEGERYVERGMVMDGPAWDCYDATSPTGISTIRDSALMPIRGKR